jgi:MtN3 and saliva related transmembrane protein
MTSFLHRKTYSTPFYLETFNIQWFINTTEMEFDQLTLLGLFAGAITSISFIPQLIKGIQTKKLDDISYWMPIVLSSGMSLWVLYGLLRQDIALIVTNVVGVTSVVLLIVLKKMYSR